MTLCQSPTIEPQHNGHLNERSELSLGVHMKGFYNWASENRKKMKLCELKMLTPFPPGSFPYSWLAKAWLIILQFLRSFWVEMSFLRGSLLKCGTALGTIRCPGETISQKLLLESWDGRIVCSTLTIVKMALAAWIWQNRENDPCSGLANTISFWIHGSPS